MSYDEFMPNAIPSRIVGRRGGGRPRRPGPAATVRSILLEDDQWQRVLDHADRLDVSASTVIRAGVAAHLDALDQAQREAPRAS